MAAHSNDAFIKKLASGNSFVPQNVDPSGSKEMGASFAQVYKKRSNRLQRKLKKAELADEDPGEDNEETLQALIRGDDMGHKQEIIDSETEEDSVIRDSDQEEIDLDKEQEKRVTPLALINQAAEAHAASQAQQPATADTVTHTTKTTISLGIPQDKLTVALEKVDFKLGIDHASSQMIQEHINRNENR